MREEIILVGGGGHCQSCIDVIEAQDEFSIAGIVDTREKMNTEVMGYNIFAGDEELPGLVKEYDYFLITLGQIKSADRRRELFGLLKGLGAKLPIIISPQSYIARSAAIGAGSIVMHKALVNAETHVGDNCIINTAAVIEHGVKIADHCHISTGALVNGNCAIGEGVFIGSNAVLCNDIYVAERTVIGAGAVVAHSVDEPGVYVGNPAKRIRNI